ncbi:MAG: radical SAM protein [Magnetococcales bacterium]|nr:radical SAM protein [Magnetococcales bacterium]
MNPLQGVKRTLDRARGRNLLEIAKFLEIELLGSHASSRCFHHPSHVLIELTTRCNLRCKWCNQNDPDWREKFGNLEMPFEKLEKIIPQLKGSQVLLLYNIGEPLLYKRIPEAIALAKRTIPTVRITTNGLLLTEKKARLLSEAGLTQLNVSIDSPLPEIMERIRGADLGKIEKNLTTFGESCQVPVQVWSVISESNHRSLMDLPQWAARFPAIKSLQFQLQNGVHTVEATGLPPLKSRESFDQLRDQVLKQCQILGLETNIGHLPFYPEGFHSRQAQGICKAPFTQLVAINVHGKLNPCCSYGTMDLGDVVSEGFQQVWNGPKMRAWRQDMLKQNYSAYCADWCGYQEGIEKR